MKAFEIFSWQPPGWPEPHPVVIVSHPGRVENKNEVNVLACSSKAATRPARPHEVTLDQADGLDWPTLCKCDLLYAVEKKDLARRRGRVSDARRSQIIATMIRANGWC